MQKVIFGKPDIAKLRKQGYECIDMHCHSTFSDGCSTISHIRDACKKLGIGIAVTDHNEIKGALAIAGFKEIRSIPGIEVSSSEGIHTLFYFHDKTEIQQFYSRIVEKNRRKENPFSCINASLAEIIDESRRYSCLISSSHPFAPARTGIHAFMKDPEFRKLMRKIPCIEAINSSNTAGRNKKAVEWGNSLKKKFTAGSDAHLTSMIGLAVTAAGCGGKFSPGSFLGQVEKGHAITAGKEVPLPMALARTLLKIRMFSRFPGSYLFRLARIMSRL